MTAHEDAALGRLVDRVRAAAADGSKLEIVGAGSKRWHGEAPAGEPLTAELAGISSYEPSELVVTARAGTPLAELEAALAERGQWLAFEPPRFAAGGTVGGMVASGLAGPGRAASGSVRDFVLGATMLSGRAEVLTFGLICEVSLKVLPRPPAVATLRYEFAEAQALQRLAAWSAQPLPISASAWWDGTLVLRLAGAAAAVQSAYEKLGGEPI
ncbi:FAD-binding protein, partial [Rubrivivax gelatinosus]|uniref:FAD-binding protein n=1 Tax=Rubrivivax gelatinosus TaxID=28068 RepID=UPI0005C2194F